MRRHPIPVLARILLAMLLLGACHGCTTWNEQGLMPAAVIAREHPLQLRVTRGDGTSVELLNPAVEGDSLKGTIRGTAASIPLADVAYVSLPRRNDFPAILGISFGVAAGLVIVIAAYGD
jgi:hypothetical protein